MLTDLQILQWTDLFQITDEMSLPHVQGSSVSSSRLGMMIDVLGILEISGSQPAPASVTAQGDLSDASQDLQPLPGGIPAARVISIRSIDLKNEKTEALFQSLSWLRHDPSIASIPESIPFESNQENGRVETCRGFFAYQIPWFGRGTEPEGPQVLDTLTATRVRSEILGLGEIATQHALHTASKAKREKELLKTYTGDKTDKSETVESYFLNLPWTTRTHRKKPKKV